MSVELPGVVPACPHLGSKVRSRGFAPDRREVFALAAVLIVAAIIYAGNFNSFQVGAYGDDAHYVVTARALAMGKGFALTNFPNARPELQFPPGFPLVLTPVALLFPGSLAAFRLPSLLFALGALPLWYFFCRRRLGFGWSYLILWAVAVNPLLVSHATMAMSEATFSFFFALLLVIGDRLNEHDRSSLFAGLALACLVTVLYFVRNAGIAMVVATLAFLLLRRRNRYAVVVLGVFVVPFAAWTLRNSVRGGAPEVSEYQHQFVTGVNHGPSLAVFFDMVGRVTNNAFLYVTTGIPEVLSVSLQGPRLDRFEAATHLTWLPVAWGFLLFLLLTIGFVRGARVQVGIAELTVVLYGALLVAWPWEIPRYLHPMLPLLYLYLFGGMRSVARSMPRLKLSTQTSSAVAGIMLGALVMVSLARDGQALINPVRDRITDLSLGARWIAQNSPKSSIVMTSSPVERSLYTERLTVDLPSKAGSSPGDDVNAIRKARASYVLIGPPLQTPRTSILNATNRELEYAITQRPDLFRAVFVDEADNVRVYEVTKSDAP